MDALKVPRKEGSALIKRSCPSSFFCPVSFAVLTVPLHFFSVPVESARR